MAMPAATRAIIKKPRHTHTDFTERDSFTSHRSSPITATLDGIGARLSGADPNHRVDRGHPDLAVADLVGPGGLGDGLDEAADGAVVGQDLDLDLGRERHV